MKKLRDDTYEPPLYTCIGGFTIAVVTLGVLFGFDWLPKHYYSWPPWNNNLKFFDKFVINTPEKFSIGMVIIVVNTFCDNYVRGVYGPWYSRRIVIGEKKDNEQYIAVYTSIILFTMYTSLSFMFSVFFAFLSIYFLVIQLVIRITVVVYLTNKYRKYGMRKMHEDEKNIENKMKDMIIKILNDEKNEYPSKAIGSRLRV